MTPEIKKILSACVEDADWFVAALEHGASEEPSAQLDVALEQGKKMRARLELLQNTVTLSLLKASAMNDSGFTLPFEAELREVKAEIERAVGGLDALGTSVASNSSQVADVGKYVSNSGLEELFRTLIRAAAEPHSGQS
jgi:hypothetical protein